ncbi:class I SAM-dependent methyltransferase [Paenibacillus lignilyticus]|uniref:Class I SAM-dependent methyltransferase n=1 Tax=Paenibacillus lignilyticus TaxID=1172615 RepID=A0ABS5CIN6_9BACL|nr:class I SAM-dependent methyltransferase [Paenibacillus lignilyticus]MBP3965728.1 class I SAM-dependent methyltransferase [Paenibacillus lignilyticus]
MGFLSVLSMAHKLVKERVSPGDTVIDATCGNGVDTLFLAELVGPRGTVYAFDIQEEALERTRQRLNDSAAGAALHLVHASHADMVEQISADGRGKAAAAMFNLGYLPGADQSVITTPDGTLAALKAALAVLRPSGIVTVVLYPGHPGGAEEADAALQWASSLPQSLAQTVLYRMAQKAEAPYLLAIEKR